MCELNQLIALVESLPEAGHLGDSETRVLQHCPGQGESQMIYSPSGGEGVAGSSPSPCPDPGLGVGPWSPTSRPSVLSLMAQPQGVPSFLHLASKFCPPSRIPLGLHFALQLLHSELTHSLSI